ncbi:MAG: site-specific integrase [Polyangiaceae bacterium]|jgi:integrase|nr:site-specific integrase [Polyangiaceae bacterium]
MGVYDRNKGKRGKAPNYWITYTAHGDRVFEHSGSDKREAERLLRERKKAVVDGTWTRVRPTINNPTLTEFSKRWIERRAHLKTVEDDEARLRDHVLPTLGSMKLDEVRPRHVQDLFLEIMRKDLAPRTIRNIATTLKTLARDAVAAEHIKAKFCLFPSQFLPRIRDKDPNWRAGAVFERGEVVALLSSERVPLDRRMFYAVSFLTGLRFGEVAGRMWREYDPTLGHLGGLSVPKQYVDSETKTLVVRKIPVHPTLALMLATWRQHGFPFYFGREPRADDLLVPSRESRVRSVRHMYRKLQEDLARLGLRGRRQHDTRATFISIGLEDGARPEVLRAVTHPSPRSMFDLYARFSWEVRCMAVGQLKIELPPQLSPREADGAHEPGDDARTNDDTAVEGNLAKVIPFPSRRR